MRWRFLRGSHIRCESTLDVEERLATSQGLPSRSSFADSDGPPPLLRSYGAASFACQKLAWFTEPKLAEGERRMVDQNSASWNRAVLWMRQLETLSQVS
jgi:hypothetical protein